MKIDIKGTNIEITESLRVWIEDKIGSLEKFLKDDAENSRARVEIEKTTLHHRKGPFFRAECQLETSKKNFRSESQRDDLRVAITEVKDDLQIQLKEGKEKFIAKLRRGQRRLKRIFKFSPAARFKKRKNRDRQEGI
jgi:putative sigma-54 modulation protein